MNQHDSNIGTCEPLRVGSVLSILLFGFSFTMLIMLLLTHDKLPFQKQEFSKHEQKISRNMRQITGSRDNVR